jgi:hypothetical protein
MITAVPRHNPLMRLGVPKTPLFGTAATVRNLFSKG